MKGKTGHILGTFLVAAGQPHFDHTHTAKGEEGVEILEILLFLREGFFKNLQAVPGKDIFDPLEKGNVSIGSQKGGADLTVFG